MKIYVVIIIMYNNFDVSWSWMVWKISHSTFMLDSGIHQFPWKRKVNDMWQKLCVLGTWDSGIHQFPWRRKCEWYVIKTVRVWYMGFSSIIYMKFNMKFHIPGSYDIWSGGGIPVINTAVILQHEIQFLVQWQCAVRVMRYAVELTRYAVELTWYAVKVTQGVRWPWRSL